MTLPTVIFLDAVGTLFGVRGTVGEIYSQFAEQAGVKVNSQSLNQAFIDSFLAAPKAAFPGVAPPDLPRHEFVWWQGIAQQAFAEVGVLNLFADFDSFFQRLFDHFATPEPWLVYPEVPQVLNQWRQQGIRLGVISNFDSRLYAVLKALELQDYFESVTISTEVGAAKPQAQMFAAAVAKHQIPVHTAWHIGDSWQDDYEGAENAGLKGIWLNREGKALPATTQTEIADLSGLSLTA
ncbi:MAG: HAD-IA family hydrolase [Acaryochloris sp. RU_4_1]|nr:HAD-IA family hydrolase [Acaryochloris sp. SU_5_25]NJM65259.1 HAD-IA family hydrolase [Acaryochloris sp. RU_4_1]NJR54823.1 HAD-IA family hydrolase [Acaryochloris sp. CRU_2_0]